MKLLKSTDISRLILSLIIIVLFLAAANAPFAMTKYRSRSTQYRSTHEQLYNAQASALGWPSKTPHVKEWPKPNDVTVWSEFGYREYAANWYNEDDSSLDQYGMTVQKLGWPLPVVEFKEMNWNQIDESLKGPESHPRPHVIPLGLILNPFIVGVSMWLVISLVPLIIKVRIRSTNQRRGLCVWCGYELNNLNSCPECGATQIDSDSSNQSDNKSENSNAHA